MNPILSNTSLLIAGLGNIGSHVVSLLADDRRFRRVVLVDSDRYDLSNLVSQAIDVADVGQFKVEAQAVRLRRFRPDLEIETMAALLEAVPFGVYRSVELILSGLDSRRARTELNERVFRSGGSMWIDGGVSADDGLARVTTLRNASEDPVQPCFECGWTEADYAAMEQRHLCLPASSSPHSTGASAELGQLAAASLMAALNGVSEGVEEEFDRETLVSLNGGIRIQTRLMRNPDCRFSHRRDPLPDFHQTIDLDRSVGSFFEDIAPGPETGFRVEGAGSWVRRLACTDCAGPPARCLHLSHRTGQAVAPTCSRCGGERLRPVGFETRPILWRDEVSIEVLGRSLASVGLRQRDEVTFLRSRNRPEPILRFAIS